MLEYSIDAKGTATITFSVAKVVESGSGKSKTPVDLTGHGRHVKLGTYKGNTVMCSPGSFARIPVGDNSEREVETL